MEAAVTGQEPVGLLEGMGADEEVGDDPIPGTTSPAVGAPGSAGLRGCLGVNCRVGDRDIGKRPGSRFVVPEHRSNLGPHDVAGDDRPLGETRPERRE